MKRTTEEIWRERVREWKASGLSAAEFCARRGFTAAGLYKWSSRLGGRARRRSMSRALVAPPVVEIVNAAGVVGRGAWPADRKPEAEPFEVFLGNRVSVRVPASFNDVAFARLIAALEHL